LSVLCIVCCALMFFFSDIHFNSAVYLLFAVFFLLPLVLSVCAFAHPHPRPRHYLGTANQELCYSFCSLCAVNFLIFIVHLGSADQELRRAGGSSAASRVRLQHVPAHRNTSAKWSVSQSFSPLKLHLCLFFHCIAFFPFLYVLSSSQSFPVFR
jgi:hypothetical protein